MKKRILITAAFLMLASLTACQGKMTKDKTVSGAAWAAVKEADSLGSYISEHGGELDMEALKAEADSDDGSLSQQFKATALLCALEYKNSLEAAGTQDADAAKLTGRAPYEYDYPVSSSYADRYLAKVNADKEEFWKSITDGYYSEDSVNAIFAAAGDLDGQTLVKFLKEAPDSGMLHYYLEDAVDYWVKSNPGKLAKTGDALMESGYFEDWTYYDWKQYFFHDSIKPDLVRAENADEALEYVAYLKNVLVPKLEPELGDDYFKTVSELDGGPFYSTGLAVMLDQELPLKEAGEGQTDPIEIEGKKVAAFYRNVQNGEFADSPAPLRLLGDFMLTLPETELPQTLADADYWLVLTPSYEYGAFYHDTSGKETKIQEVYSTTSVDLYEAGAGTFLRHLGNVMELPSAQIYKDLTEEAAQFPELIPADELSYIYHNINEPEKYATLTDNTTGLLLDMQKEESVLMGKWQITFHSAQIKDSVEDSLYAYAPSEGCKFVIGEFTVANAGFYEDTFLPQFITGATYASDTAYVRITDSTKETFYENLDPGTMRGALNKTPLAPGESKTGQLYFEVPDEALESGEPLYFMVYRGNQKVYYPLEK